ncbi:hypothetical protein [Kitasatospora sp. NPDC008115]|uniref:hypothetical protein n=1 Tax=Kitasatospora sp. NPDC008115 TaxID=3364022 RepID=UPI0036E94C4B
MAERLSAACGRAQVLFQDPFTDSVIRAAAEDGALVRGYRRYGEPERTGEPLPREPLPTAEERDDEGLEPNASLVGSVGAAAAPLRGLRRDHRRHPVRGHGRPALTSPGAGHDGFGGAPVL